MKVFNLSHQVRVPDLMDLRWNSIIFTGLKLVNLSSRRSGIFFEHSVMPNAWGRTFITLIRKIPNPKIAFDYHSIS